MGALHNMSEQCNFYQPHDHLSARSLVQRKFFMSTELLCAALFLSAAFFGCTEKQAEGLRINQKTELEGDLNVLANERIFFGHQSVGANIIEGLKEIAKENPADSLHVVHWENNAPLPSAFFLEGLIGENYRPKSKSDDFVHIVDELGPNALTIALMKFCFLDVSHETDVDRVFDEYKTAVKALQQRHPSTTFVHVTVPLTTQPDILRRVYRFLRGRSIDHTADNQARERFNDRLRREFAKEAIFDLAAIESTRPDGSREKWGPASGTCYALAKEYAGDEGHLNEYGRKTAAIALVRTLAQAVRERDRK
jgi:hypothetical protein